MYLFTPYTQPTAMNSKNPMSSKGTLPANWSNKVNRYTPLPRTKGMLTVKNTAHTIAAEKR